jgi:polysaccharide pyruvyl transferase WcaK-like protein
MMKILVDHGSSYNLGDTAMIEGVVSRLMSILPGAEIFVIDRPNLKTMIWDLPGVSRQKEYVAKPIFADMFSGVRFFWRFNGPWQRAISKITLACMGKILSLRSLPISKNGKSEKGSVKLGEFCEQFDALHIVGGANLTDTFYRELFRRCVIILAFAEQGKPIILTGQQLGPFNSRMLRQALTRTLHKADFVGLREPVDSLTFCQEAHIDPKRLEVMGDDSFGLSPADDSLILGLLAQYGLKPNEFLAFNVRIGYYAQEHAKHVQKIAAIVDKIARQFQMPVVIVPIALNPSDSDIRSGKELAKAVRSANVLVLENNLTPALVKGVLGKAFGAVGVSYHFCTFALSQGVPAVCIYVGDYYAQKARGLCGFWQDERLALSLKDINTDWAVDHIVQVFKDELLRKKLNLLGKTAIEFWQDTFDRQVKNIFVGLA